MRESIFTSEIMKSLREANVWCYKIPDNPTSWTMARTRYTPEKPCDIVASFNGRAILLELKQIRKWQAFGKTQIRGSQFLSLTEASKAGAKCFVLLNIRIKPEGENKRENRLVVFDWNEWGSFFLENTIKAKDLIKHEYVSGRKGRFDLSSLLDKIHGL